ncbi:hypothetical protein AX16_009575 [Volvariella volvacea WC 439]|nr:hypothetical protein AX16_009575 [Volvariella volvacea WC 439]
MTKPEHLCNRAAQRAFRERKQTQLAELQARVQSYEQGEIERSVALQNIAKRLKEENDNLRRENASLKERMSQLEHRAQEAEKKRWRQGSPSPNSADTNHRKKTKAWRESSREISPSIMSTAYLPSPPSMISSPENTGTGDPQFSGMTFENSGESLQTSLSNLLDISKSTTQPSSSFLSCGFCTESSACMCRELSEPTSMSAIAEQVKIDDISQAMAHENPSMVIDTPTTSSTSILDNLPAYQPPVPLPRKSSTSSSVNTVFPVYPQITTVPTCSGDPQNCMACADDSFGKAFCTAIEEAICQTRCANCPCNVQHALGQRCGPECRQSQSETAEKNESLKTIPTNQAWQQIKSHPNASFADLTLLADVVVGRSACAGPRVEISPPPDSVAEERITSHDPYTDSDRGHIDLTNPRVQFREGEALRKQGSASPPRLVPEEILVRCGRRRVREVHMDAVREALRVLDAKLPRP